MDNSVLCDDMVDGLKHSLELFPEAVSIVVRNVPRHEFVTDLPYRNRPAGHRDANTTVLVPTTVVRLLVALDSQPGGEVFVVGASVGYTAVVLVETVGGARAHAVDIMHSLVYEAHENLQRADYGGVLVDRRDGAKELADYTPFDRILVGALVVRPLVRLLAQLADGGRLVMPKSASKQTLVAVEDGEVAESFGPLSFESLPVDGKQTRSIVRNQTRREDPEYKGHG